jgi:hypothetical protein
MDLLYLLILLRISQNWINERTNEARPNFGWTIS